VDFQLHLETETVDHAHLGKPVSAAPEASIRSVIRLLQEAKTGAAMICGGGKLQGIFTERDVLKVLASGADLDGPISGVMISNPVTLRANDTIGKAISLMSAGGFRRLPVVDSSGTLTGVLKVSGILSYLVEHFPKVIYTLPPEPHHKTSEREGA
jgi:CBS domain-containing protein